MLSWADTWQSVRGGLHKLLSKWLNWIEGRREGRVEERERECGGKEGGCMFGN